MIIRLLSIDFDFETDDKIGITDSEKKEIVKETMSKVWQVDDEEDLVDDISDETGWCIKGISYCILAPS